MMTQRRVKTVSRKAFFRGLVAGAAVLALAACASGPSTSSPSEPGTSESSTGQSSGSGDPIRLGYQTNIWGMPVHAALEGGFIDDAGVTVEATPMVQGRQIRDLIVAGQMDVGTFAGPTLIGGMLAGDVVAVGLVAETGGTVGIAAGADSGITSIEQLRGKKIASESGSSIEAAGLAYLESVGLTTDDFELLNVRGDNMVAALARGAVDAMIDMEPYIASGVNQGIAVKLVDFGEFDPMPVFVGMSRSFIERDRPAAVGFLRGLAASAEAWNADPSAANANILAFYESTGFKADLSVIEAASAGLRVQVEMRPEIAEYLEALAAKQLEAGQIEEVPDFSKTIDTSLLDEALNS